MPAGGPSSVEPMVGQGRAVGSPATASLGQGLTAWGGDMGSWATGSGGSPSGDWAGTVRTGSALKILTN